MKIINPSTEEVLAEIHEDTKETVLRKFHSLKKGQPAWAAISLQERIACIARFNEHLENDKDEPAVTLSSEMGKPLKESYNELNGARARIQFFIDHSEKYLREEWITTEGN